MPADGSDFYNDLDRSLMHAFNLLSDAVTIRHAPCHTPAIATISSDGQGRLVPSVRIVVLRAFDARSRSFQFHTDARSGKVDDLERNRILSGLFYDPAEKIQIRLTGVCQIASQSALANQAWAGTRDVSRATYGVQPGPGTQISNGDAYHKPSLEEDQPDANQPEADPPDADFGRSNFSVVDICFNKLEWLYLAPSGHRRAEFNWDEGGILDSKWLVP